MTYPIDTRNHSSGVSKLYASIASDTDLAAAYPLATSSRDYKLPRQIIVHGSGDLAYTEEHDSGTTITVPVTAPYTYDIAPRILKAATTATSILVLW